MAPGSLSARQSATHLLPKRLPWYVFFLTVAVRVHYVTQPHNWWILHPDEIFQSLEVAHAEMYGYGFRTFEYMPPERTPDMPSVRYRELDYGMAALRSFLVPRAYVMVTWLLELFGFSFAPFVAWKVAHAVVSSTLPLAVYRYVMAVFRSHDTACLAAILCAACAQLHVLGTHTLVNSLLAPPIFFALAHLQTLLVSSSTETNDINDLEEDSLVKTGHGFSSGAVGNGMGSPRGKSGRKDRGKHSRFKNEHATQNHSGNSAANGDSYDIHGKFTPARNGQDVHRNGNTVSNGKDVHRNGNAISNGKDVHRNGNMISNGKIHRDVNGNLCDSPVTDAAKHMDHGSGDQSWTSFSPGGIVSDLVAGAVLGICCYIRTDLAALVMATLLPQWRPTQTRYSDVIVAVFGVLGGVALGVWEDFGCYGWGVLTPVNWYRFNVENDYSAVFFGADSLYVYVFDIFFQNYGMTVLTVLSSIGAVTAILCWRQAGNADQTVKTGVTRNENRSLRSAVGTVAGWLVLLVLYSSKSHKEIRFVHNVIVLVLITCAVTLKEGITRVAGARSSKMSTILAVGVVCFALSQWHDVHNVQENHGLHGNRLAFKQSGDTQDVNICLHYVSKQNDVTGVLIDRNLYATAGYAILHRNVPIFTVLNNHFYEYTPEDRLTYTSRNLIGSQKNVSVAYLSSMSNYVSAVNAQYVMKFVLEDRRYNYLVVMQNRDFLQFGFGTAVFQHGAFKVLKREANPGIQERQSLIAANSEPVHNATVLLHEADKLTLHGAWARAIERFKAVLRVDPGVVGAYSPMAFCYKQLGDVKGFKSTLRECYARFGEEACERPRGIA